MTIDRALKLAEANLRIEGQSISPLAREVFELVKRGELTLSAARVKIMDYYAQLSAKA